MREAEPQEGPGGELGDRNQVFSRTLWFLVLLSCVFFLPHQLSPFFLPKLTWVVGALSLWAIYAALRPTQSAHHLAPFEMAWLLYLLWAFIACSWSQQARVALERCVVLVIITCVYALALMSAFWRSRVWWRAFSLVMAAIAAVGCLQHFFPEFPVIGAIPTRGAPSVTMGYRNQAAMFVALSIPFLLWQTVHDRPAWSVVSLLSSFTAIGFVVVCRTRSAWLALVLGGVYVGALLLAFSHSRVRTRSIAIGLMLVLGLLVLPGEEPPVGQGTHFRKGIPKFKRTVSHTFLSALHGHDAGRLQMWRTAIKDATLLGCGPGNFAIKATPRHKEVLQLNWEVHNDYLQNLLELGVPGLLLFLAFWTLLLTRAARQHRQSLALAAGASVVVVLVMQAFSFTSWKISTLVWLAGVAAIIRGTTADSPQLLSWRIPPWFLAIARICLPAVSLIFFLVLVATLRADHRLHTQALSPSMPLAEVHRDIISQFRFGMPILHLHTHMLAKRAIKFKLFQPAHDFAQSAFRIHPGDRIALQILAETECRKGNAQLAIGLQKRAIRLLGDHKDATALKRLAVYYEQAQMPLEASKARRRARKAETSLLDEDR